MDWAEPGVAFEMKGRMPLLEPRRVHMRVIQFPALHHQHILGIQHGWDMDRGDKSS